MRKRKRCVICDFKFDEKFPKHFPGEFKLCCSCRGLAITLSNVSIDDIVDFYTKIFGPTKECLPIIEKYKKINKLITINHEGDAKCTK